MDKNEIKQQFLKLTKAEKDELTIKWLIQLVKDNNLQPNDVMDIINSLYENLIDIEKFNKLSEYKIIRASTISRVFSYGYVKSMKIINLLIENNAIIKIDNGYKVISKANFRQVGKILFNK